MPHSPFAGKAKTARPKGRAVFSFGKRHHGICHVERMPSCTRWRAEDGAARLNLLETTVGDRLINLIGRPKAPTAIRVGEIHLTEPMCFDPFYLGTV